jgi:hypothetical protein
MVMRTLAGFALLAPLALTAGCKDRPLVGYYCELGGHPHNVNGGECFVIKADKLDADPTIVGTASWTRADKERYGVRRTAQDKYNLLLGSDVIGTVDNTNDDLRVTVRHAPPGLGIATDSPYFLRTQPVER